MKKLHPFAFYALVTPAITLGAGSVLAEQSTDQDIDRDQQSTQYDEDAKKPTSRTGQSDQTKEHANQYDSHPAVDSAQHDEDARKPTSRTGQSDQTEEHAKQYDSHPAVDQRNARDQSRMQNRGYMSSAPANGMHASGLIGAEVKTSADEDVGSVSDLIIDENGQVVAIIVGVGGFLGMGEKNVAIGWDDVTRSNASGEQELQIDMTREELRSAPKFEMLEMHD